MCAGDAAAALMIALDWFVVSRAGSDDDYPAFSPYVAPTADGVVAGVAGSL
jgi:hypothetical protein